MNNGHPTELANRGWPDRLPAYDHADVFAVSCALYDRIVECMHTTAIKNKFYLNSEQKCDTKRRIIDAGEKRARAFARDFGVKDWNENIIARIDEAPDHTPTPYDLDEHIQYTPLPNWEEIQFRVVIHGAAYERLVAAICAQK